MRKASAILYCLITLAGSGYASVTAAPFIISDPTTQTTKPTHCGEYVYKADSKGVLQPVYQKDHVAQLDASGNPYCKIDIASYAAGTVRVAATFVRADGVFPRVESPLSAPLEFTKPGPLVAPLGLGLSP